MMTLTARLCAMCAVSALLQLALPDGRMRGGLRIVSGLLMLRLTLGGAALPADPTYRQSGLNECVSFASAGERELVFRTENIPTDANVVVKVTPRQSGKDFTGTTVPATMDAGGTFAQATWRAHIPLNDARTTFQVLVSTVPLNE